MTRFTARGRAADEPQELRELALELIRRNPEQPRRRFDPVALQALADSLESSGGVIEPVLVRPKNGVYELVAGERRWRAAHLASQTHISALVRDIDDLAAFELSITENSAREDLTPLEEARAYAILCDRHHLSKAEIARRVGRSREGVSNLIRLLELPDSVLELIDSGRLSEAHGRALLTCHDHAARRALARRAVAGAWSAHTLERIARETQTGAPPQRHGPAGTPHPGPAGTPHPDQLYVAEELQTMLSHAFGRDVHITPAASSYEITLCVEDPQDAADMLANLTRSENQTPRP